MANSKSSGSETETDEAPYSRQENAEQSFFIHKAFVQLKITLQNKIPFVEVASCSEANRRLAESVARVQQQLLIIQLQNYRGENPCAFLLAFYNNPGWEIRQAEEEVLKAKGDRKRIAKK